MFLHPFVIEKAIVKTSYIGDASLRLLSCFLLLGADIEHPSQPWEGWHLVVFLSQKFPGPDQIEQHASVWNRGARLLPFPYSTFYLQNPSNVMFLLDAGNAICNAMALTLILQFEKRVISEAL